MNRYGQNITWSTPGAPHPFHGICTAYSYKMQLQRQLDEDENGDNHALIQHSRKANVSFEAKVLKGTGGSTDFLDLSAGGAVALSNAVPGGGPTNTIVLATRAVERWSLGQPATISLQATHYPDLVQSSPAMAGALDASAAIDQTGLGIITPGGKIIYGTYPLAMPDSSGIVHKLEITQELKIAEDDPSPAGTILGAATHGYLRTISLDLLATGSAPAEGSTLSITGAPSNAANYKIESVEQKFAEKRGKMYSITAVWIPPLG